MLFPLEQCARQAGVPLLLVYELLKWEPGITAVIIPFRILYTAFHIICGSRGITLQTTIKPITTSQMPELLPKKPGTKAQTMQVGGTAIQDNRFLLFSISWIRTSLGR